MLIGQLINGKFYCLDCAAQYTIPPAPEFVPVYEINIRPYSQQCSVCNKIVVNGLQKADGSGPLNLFE